MTYTVHTIPDSNTETVHATNRIRHCVGSGRSHVLGTIVDGAHRSGLAGLAGLAGLGTASSHTHCRRGNGRASRLGRGGGWTRRPIVLLVATRSLLWRANHFDFFSCAKLSQSTVSSNLVIQSSDPSQRAIDCPLPMPKPPSS